MGCSLGLGNNFEIKIWGPLLELFCNSSMFILSRGFLTAHVARPNLPELFLPAACPGNFIVSLCSSALPIDAVAALSRGCMSLTR
jgi:hypothetical protein